MEAHEWYDNYFCKKCKKQVHENHNIPKHDCVIDKYNATGDMLDFLPKYFLMVLFLFIVWVICIILILIH